jgi:hypothetical protein
MGFTPYAADDLISPGGGAEFLLPLLPAPPANERINAMNDVTIGPDQTEEEIPTYEVSDEALEAMAGAGKEKAGNYTLGACTGLSVCPG